MNLLCLNTAFPEAHISLAFENNNFFKSIDSNCKHSENLLLEVEKLLENICTCESNSSEILNKIDAIAVVVGPGSFTGLRISIATAKAILSTHPQMKAIAITSLELIANESKNTQKTAIIDALSGFYFIAEFDQKTQISKPKMIKSEDLKSYANFVACENIKLPELIVEKIDLSPESLLKTAQEKFIQNDFISENELVPLYIRPSQAEANLASRN